jgi:ATP-binding cassette subfamily B protein
MKHFPHYIQHDTMDCGPTCLRMVAAFYGKHYSLEGLREKSFITRENVMAATGLVASSRRS